MKWLPLAMLLTMSACGPVAERERGPETPTPAPPVHPSPTPRPAGPAATPLPPLDSAWDSLPVPPTPEPFRIEPTDTASNGEAPGMFPRATPTGRVLEVADAVWGAGFLNGRPGVVDEEVPPGEYAAERSFAAVVHMRDPSEFPAFLEPGQTLVMHLPALPPDVYSLRVYTTGDDPVAGGMSGFANSKLARERNLAIRWNDRVVWRRFHSPYADEIRVALNPARLQPEGNLITIENRGDLTMPLDAVRLVPLRPGRRPFFVALEDGEWLPAREAPWARTVVVDVPAPGTRRADLPALDASVRSAPREGADVRSAWPRVENRYRLLEALEHPDLETYREWIPPLRDAAARGMTPLIRVKRGPPYTLHDLRAAAFLFGDVAGGWDLGPRGDARVAREDLRAFIDDPVFLNGHSDRNPHLPRTRALESAPWYQTLPHLGRALRRWFNGGETREQVARFNDTAYLLLPHQSNVFDSHKQGLVGDLFFKNTAELLHVGGWHVKLYGGFPCGPFFPDGTGRASELWRFVRPMFRFGGVGSRESLANLVPDRTGTHLNAAFWAVADNGTDRVEVLAAVPYRKGESMRLQVPLPWSGPTRVRHHGVFPDWNNPAAGKTESTVRVVEAEALPLNEGPFRGWLELPFVVARLHVFELSPAGAPAGIVPAPNLPAVERQRVPEVRNLFDVSETPPPAWWSRERLGRVRDWNWGAYGPMEIRPNTPTRSGRLPVWKPLVGFHPPQTGEAEGATPLMETSTTLRFGDNPEDVPQVARWELEFNLLQRAEAVGLWIRAHPAVGSSPQPDGHRARPHTRFWVGNRGARQLVEIPYGAWCFLGGSASFWQTEGRHLVRVQKKAMMFWPDETLDLQPVLEVNSFDAYKISLERGLETPDRTLGFVHERKDGSLALLVVGLPGKAAFWRERLDRFIDPDTFRHVEDAPRVVSAESPDDPPPEEVRHRLTWNEEARLLETHIPKMPPPPTGWYRKRILEDFPLIGHRLNSGNLSAVLFNEVRDGDGGAK